MEIIPANLSFSGIVKKIKFVQTIQIRNIASRSARIRIECPTLPLLSVRHNHLKAIAPNMTLKFQVTFYAQSADQLPPQITEKIRIKSSAGVSADLPVSVTLRPHESSAL